MWTIEALIAEQEKNEHTVSLPASSFLVQASTPIESVVRSLSDPAATTRLDDDALEETFREGGRGACVALADYCARRFLDRTSSSLHGCREIQPAGLAIRLEPVDAVLHNQSRRKRRQFTTNAIDATKDISSSLKRQKLTKNRNYPPYVVERTDFWCNGNSDANDNGPPRVHIMVRMIVECSNENTQRQPHNLLREACQIVLTKCFNGELSSSSPSCSVMTHVATVVLQQRLRSKLASLEAVAFVADGSILPRRSGASQAPMASPPAVPFRAPSIFDPEKSPLSSCIQVDMGRLADHLPSTLPVTRTTGTSITLSGLLIGGGVHLICGGGYHGKSTLLQTIAAGVYDKIPGDGREFCATVQMASTVRAEDGRYVHNCNISAFISNLPTPPGVTTALDTQHFSSRDASGSTSQAANVVEAMELGTTALLVDEDISAANFMARDGRMRALVMDESITPLLYRVNGLYQRHKISSIVVVGGVGDWLDVPHSVILMDKYLATDATPKARSISYQFSYGHVQFGGRGVVHRLEWDRSGNPLPRRPVDACCRQYDSDVAVSLLDGGHSIALRKEVDMDISESDDGMMSVDDEDEEEGIFDASRMEQLLGRRQLYGCGLCVVWLLQKAPYHPQMGLQDLLKLLDSELDRFGMTKLLKDLHETPNGSDLSHSWLHMLETVGYAERPRSMEVGQALTRLHGVQFEEAPVVEKEEYDAVEEAKRNEEERKKQALAELWSKRRSKSNTSSTSSDGNSS